MSAQKNPLELKRIQREHIENSFPHLERVVSTGSSYIYRGEWTSKSAIWKISHHGDDESSRLAEVQAREYEILSALKGCQGIIQIYGQLPIAGTDDTPPMTATLLEDGGSSIEQIQENDRYSYIGPKGRVLRSEILNTITLQLLRAGEALEEKGVVHRDIKSSNVTFREDDDIGTRIIDFGIATTDDAETIRRSPNIVGSLDFIDWGFYFEVLDSQSYSRDSPQLDIFATGMTILYMAGHQYMPYETETWHPVIEDVCSPACADADTMKRIHEAHREQKELMAALSDPGTLRSSSGIILEEGKLLVVQNALKGAYDSFSDMRKEWEKSAQRQYPA